MSKPESFIQNSDYATIKNDGYATFNITLPGGIVIAPNDNYTTSQDFQLGNLNANERARIASSKDGTKYYSCLTLSTSRTGVAGGFSAPYSTFAMLRRSTPTTLKAEIVVNNPYSDPLTCEAGDQTFYYEVNTFISPFN